MSSVEKVGLESGGNRSEPITSLLRKAWASYAPSSRTLQGFWLGFACAELGALGVLVGQLTLHMVRP
jgi:hypothetical protein